MNVFDHKLLSQALMGGYVIDMCNYNIYRHMHLYIYIRTHILHIYVYAYVIIHSHIHMYYDICFQKSEKSEVHVALRC